MEPQHQEPAGDYGYDMAHQDVGRPSPAPQPPRDPEPRRAPEGGPSELDRDYSYDEAHSF